MSNTFIDLIKQMHTKFGIANNEGPTQLSPEEKEFRINCLKEEVREFAEAQSLEDQLDAILDCVVFCIGTLERMGMLEISEEAFKRIMQANMNKTIGTATKEREGGKSFKLDLVKPVDWAAPQFSDLI